MAGHAHRMARADSTLLARLAEPRTRGLRAWEYGTLLGYLQYAGALPSRALDVGSGDSAFPSFLVSSGAVESVTALDLPDAFEDLSDATLARESAQGVTRLAGSMLDIPVVDASFDLVTCISAIEHLDGHSADYRRNPEQHPRLPYAEYLQRTTTALEEMVRVLRPNGILYVTTDAYVSRFQKTDAWSKFDTGGVIWSAYRFEDVRPVFLDTLERAGAEIVGPPRLDESMVIDDRKRSTFRGRYFTSFAVVGRKVS